MNTHGGALPSLPPAPASRWILCLSGGGYKGLFTARFLQKLESEIGPLHSRFDLIAGTSIGSIIALGVAAEVETKDIAELLATQGPAIFPARRRLLPWLLATLAGPRYSQRPLKKALEGLFGATTLGDLAHNALVPALSLTSGRARLFRSPRADDPAGLAAVTLVDAALASAAAPLYFPPHLVDDELMADGGLIANLPAIAALIEATSHHRWPVDDVHVLCVGTTEVAEGVASFKTTSWGWRRWLRRKILLRQMMAGQQDLSMQLAKSVLGERIVRVDILRSAQQDSAVDLDLATPLSRDTLQAMATSAWQHFTDNEAAVLAALKAHRTPGS